MMAKVRWAGLGFILACLGLVWVQAKAPQPGDKLYPKQDRAPLRAEPHGSAKVVNRLQWGQAYPVTGIRGRWVALKAGKQSGWIYVGNMSRDRPPEDNKSDFLPTRAGEVSTAAAARGLEKGALAYGQRQGSTRAIADVQWMERFNDSISDQELQAYMVRNQLGEYGGQP